MYLETPVQGALLTSVSLLWRHDGPSACFSKSSTLLSHYFPGAHLILGGTCIALKLSENIVEHSLYFILLRQSWSYVCKPGESGWLRGCAKGHTGALLT